MHGVTMKYIEVSLSCSDPCTDVTILRKNPTNALIYVRNTNSTAFTLLICYMFRPTRGLSRDGPLRAERGQ